MTATVSKIIYTKVDEAPALKDELDRFLAQMREHEREEEALVTRALRHG